jgi:hypothetical protein
VINNIPAPINRAPNASSNVVPPIQQKSHSTQSGSSQKSNKKGQIQMKK